MEFMYFYFLARALCSGIAVPVSNRTIRSVCFIQFVFLNVVFWYLTHAQGLLVSAGAARFVCLLAGWKLRRWIAFQTKSASRRPAPGFGGPAEYSAEY